MDNEVSLEMAKALDVKRAVWNLRVNEAKSVSEIADQLGLTEKDITEFLNDEYELRQEQLDGLVTREKLMDLERLDQLLGQYMKVSKVDAIRLTRIVKGEPVDDWDPDVPIKAALVVLQIIEKKSRILGYEPIRKKKEGVLDQAWLAERQNQIRGLLGRSSSS